MSSNLADRLVRPNIKKLVPYQSARGTAKPEEGFVFLDAAENPFSPFEDESDWVLDSLNRYPEQQPSALLSRLSDIYETPAENILLTRGSEEGIRILMQTFCEPQKDSILLCPPTFGLYNIEAAIHDVSVVNVPRHGEFFDRLDGEKIVENVQNDLSHIKLIFVCNPGNPTSASVNMTDIETLLNSLEDDCFVVVDEAYIEFSDQPSFAQKLSEYKNLIVLRTLSKTYGLAGVRCGSILADASVIQYLKRIMAAYPVPQSTARIVEKALDPNRVARMQEHQIFIKHERERIINSIKDSKNIQKLYPSNTNFLCVEVSNPEKCVASFYAHKIIVRNRSAAIPGAVNIAIGAKKHNDQVIDILCSSELLA